MCIRSRLFIETEIDIHRVVSRSRAAVPQPFRAVAMATAIRSAQRGRATLAHAISVARLGERANPYINLTLNKRRPAHWLG
jgi:hypothetical protein